MKKLSSFLVLLFICSASVAELKVDDPHEREVLEIGAKLRCAVCQNESIAESRSDLATDMRAIISEQLEAGQSEQQIIDYFKERYGDYILMMPVKSGIGAPLWVVPFLILLLAVVFVLIRAKKQGVKNEDLPLPEISDKDRQLIEQARQEKQD